MTSKRKTCSIENCQEKHEARGWCKKHYLRWYKHGDPTFFTGKRSLCLEEAFQNKTERQGDCLIWTGHKNTAGYGQMVSKRKSILAHRYSWERVNGKIPDGMEIDHKCWNPSCVNIEHLRLATSSQNGAYRRSAKKIASSGYRNVNRHKDKWVVVVKKHGKSHFFGTYEDVEEAAVVAEAARQELFGEFAGRG